ncbi:hypothetical protein G3A43_08115 [Paraburkholderia aspalathi]|nr:hypothetical protein [Paraburkholderia aspalathi]MBK3780221.1 hypothetical protein [Paraburkholderia aspalathi]
MTIHNFSDYARLKPPAPLSGDGEKEGCLLLLAAPAGQSRKLQVLSHVAGYLAQDADQGAPLAREDARQVVILAQDPSFYHLTRALSGSYTVVHGAEDDDNRREEFGSCQLHVFDLTSVGQPLREPPNELAFGYPNTLLVIDGAKHMLERFPGVGALVTRYAKEGNGVLIVGDDRGEVLAYQGAYSQVLLLEPADA